MDRSRSMRANSGVAAASMISPQPVHHSQSFIAANKAALKSLQHENRARQQEQAVKQRQQPFKMARFANIGSAINDKLEEQRTKTKGQERAFLRKHEGSSVVKKGTAGLGDDRDRFDAYQREPRADDLEQEHEQDWDEDGYTYQQHTQAPYAAASLSTAGLQSLSEPSSRPASHYTSRGSSQSAASTPRNFIATNALAVIRAAPVRTDDASSKTTSRHSEYGRVPVYLQARKAAMAAKAEEEREARQRATIPAGMRQISEQERRQTLDKLTESAKELEQQIAALPLRIETFARRRQKEELLTKLADVESAMQLFAKPVVYVAMQ